MFGMLVIVDCMAIASVYLCHQCISLVALVNSVEKI